MEELIKAIIKYNQIEILSFYTGLSTDTIYKAILNNTAIKSPFRQDANPSVKIIVTNTKYGKKLFFKDLANSYYDKDLFDIVGFYIKKSTKNKKEFVEIIDELYSRFIIKTNNIFIDNVLDSINVKHKSLIDCDTIDDKSKVEFDFKLRDANKDDFEYWNQYNLPLDYVASQNYMFVDSFKYIIDGEILETGYKYHFRNPCYAYYSGTTNGIDEFKLNFPFAGKDKRFRTNIKTVIECLYDIQEANNLIIVKSRKDAIYLKYYIHKQNIKGTSVVNVRSENVKFTEEYIRLVKNISNNRTVFFDGDTVGKSNAITLVESKIADRYIFIEEFYKFNKNTVFIKDPTDLNKYRGLTYTYNKLDNLFKLIL